MLDKYIIVEIIPNHSDYKKGIICQIQALKLNGLKLVSRFDYRVFPEIINNITISNMINYDCDFFNYTDLVTMKKKFKEFVEDYKILILDDNYTKDYLSYLENKKDLIYPYLDMTYSLNFFDEISAKYNLKPSNHLVDLIYEALIYKTNKK